MAVLSVGTFLKKNSLEFLEQKEIHVLYRYATAPHTKIEFLLMFLKYCSYQQDLKLSCRLSFLWSVQFFCSIHTMHEFCQETVQEPI